MLLNNFFKIDNIQSGETHIAYITLNPGHRVYAGHFPGSPIAPGVCLVQMVKETLETILGNKLFMESCSNIKFTAVLNPFMNPGITLKIDHSTTENGMHQANCTISDGETKFVSLKGYFKEMKVQTD